MKENVPLYLALLLSLGLHLGLLLCGKSSTSLYKSTSIEIDLNSTDWTATEKNKPEHRRTVHQTHKTDNKPILQRDETKSDFRPQAENATSSIKESLVSKPDSTEELDTQSLSTTPLSRFPEVLNWADVSSILQRFYPDRERLLGKQGKVVLDLHIDTHGRIVAVDIVESDWPAFNKAAVRAAKMLRFSPAFIGSRPVAVKIRQNIQFRLQ